MKSAEENKNSSETVNFNNTGSMEHDVLELQKELEKTNRDCYKLKQELKESIEKYENIYEFSPTGYFTFNENGSILSLNSTGADQLGSDKEHLLEKSFNHFIVLEHRSHFNMHLQNVFTYRKRHTCEVKIERKDRSLFYALLESVPTYENDSSTITCRTAVNDITMLKVAEEAIKESEARFQNMANTAPVLIWITDTDALFTFVNNFWLQFTGRMLGQELGMSWLEGIHPDDLNPFIEVYKKSFDTRTPFEIEFRLKNLRGEYRWLVSKGVPRFQSDGRFAGYIGSCTDINDQKIIEETVKKFNEELKSLNASKDKFFSIIAHDLKSPLSGLLGFTEILVEEYEDLQDEEIVEFIGHSHQAAKNLNALLENLLDWSRIQIGSIPFDPALVAVELLVDDVFNLFYQNAKNKLIKLEKHLPTEVKVFADKNMFKTILRNLISNGIKFTPEGGLVTVSAEIIDKYVKITVKDSGVGISEQNIQKLFRIDMNFSTQGTQKERGTGLGLILCKELIVKNGGHIWVESEVTKGTKFIFTLPKY